MRIVVSDSSCLIDLRKVSMLELLLRLPYEFLIPNTLFEEELLKFTAAQKKALIRGGLKIVDLPGERVLRAQAIVRKLPRLSVHDGFAFALAESHRDCILLSGDDRLRTLAAEHAIEVHGVLWALDQLHANRLTPPQAVLNVLRAFMEDATVRLPRRELSAYFKRYESLK
jgi:predicted nucleic acid-binding protein